MTAALRAEGAGVLQALRARRMRHHRRPARAEMSKLVENAFRDVNIAFANELSDLPTRWISMCGK